MPYIIYISRLFGLKVEWAGGRDRFRHETLTPGEKGGLQMGGIRLGPTRLG